MTATLVDMDVIRRRIDAVEEEAKQLRRLAEGYDPAKGIVIRSAALTVEHDGKTCKLGRRAFDVLHRLLRARGTYVDLLDCFPCEPKPSAVRMAVHRTRFALQRCGMNSMASHIVGNGEGLYAFRQ